MLTVMVVEDEYQIRELVRFYLERADLTVISTGSGAEALSLARSNPVDLVVLDLGLPDVAGEEVARELRTTTDVPIVMLTAKSDEADCIAGLEMGADDYITKPFSPRELVLRVQAVLRRGRSREEVVAPASYGGGELVIDEEHRHVEVRGATVELTPTEWGILATLAGAPGRVYSRYELVNRVRGYEFYGGERTVDSHVKNLRKKVEANPSVPLVVQTVTGCGYRFGLRRDK